MDENIGTLMAQVSRLLRRSFDERARGIGVTRPQWQVLSLLKIHAGSNQGALAEILEVEPDIQDSADAIVSHGNQAAITVTGCRDNNFAT